MRSNSRHKQHTTAEDATWNLLLQAADDECGMPHAFYASQIKLTKSKIAAKVLKILSITLWQINLRK